MEVFGVCFGFQCFSVFLSGGFVVWCLVWMVCCLVRKNIKIALKY